MKLEEEKEIDILLAVKVMYRFKLKILLAALIITGIGGAIIFRLHDSYKSEAVFIVTQKEKDNPLEQWSILAEQFGFKMGKMSDPLLSMLDRVLRTDQFYRSFIGLSLNPRFSQDSSLIRVFKIENLTPDKQAKALTSEIVSRMKFVTNKDNSYSIIVTSKVSSLSKFLANRITENLNQFFLKRARTELDRKIAFLSGELVLNKREVDSLSNRLRIFLEANKDFSSPLLNFKNKEINQELTIAVEKFMLTMKAHQSLKISASQPDYFFESLTPAEEAGPTPLREKLKWVFALFSISIFFCSACVIVFNWLLRVVPEKST